MLDFGYNYGPPQRHFIGFVERSTAINSVQQILVCRELAAILSQPMPLNLRHVDLQGMLAEVSDKTGLHFRVPDKAYAKVKAPFFYSLAAGYLAMDSLASVFRIPDFMWQQQATTKCSWAVGPTASSGSAHRCSCRLNCSTATRATRAH